MEKKLAALIIKYIGVLFFALLATQSSYGTVIVIIRTKTTITVGADSKRWVTFEDASKNYIDPSWCKIRQSGKFFYCLGGYHDDMQMFFANNAGSRAKTIEEFVTYFKDPVGRTYQELMEKQRKSNIDLFNRNFKKGKEFAQIPVFTIQNGKTELVTFRYKLVSDSDHNVQVFGSYDINQAKTVLGYTDHYDYMPNELSLKYNQLIEPNPVEYIKSIVHYEESYHRQMIGGPIDILQLSVAEGVHWIYRKENCDYKPVRYK